MQKPKQQGQGLAPSHGSFSPGTRTKDLLARGTGTLDSQIRMQQKIIDDLEVLLKEEKNKNLILREEIMAIGQRNAMRETEYQKLLAQYIPGVAKFLNQSEYGQLQKNGISQTFSKIIENFEKANETTNTFIQNRYQQSMKRMEFKVKNLTKIFEEQFKRFKEKNSIDVSTLMSEVKTALEYLPKVQEQTFSLLQKLKKQKTKTQLLQNEKKILISDVVQKKNVISKLYLQNKKLQESLSETNKKQKDKKCEFCQEVSESRTKNDDKDQMNSKFNEITLYNEYIEQGDICMKKHKQNDQQNELDLPKRITKSRMKKFQTPNEKDSSRLQQGRKRFFSIQQKFKQNANSRKVTSSFITKSMNHSSQLLQGKQSKHHDSKIQQSLQKMLTRERKKGRQTDKKLALVIKHQHQTTEIIQNLIQEIKNFEKDKHKQKDLQVCYSFISKIGRVLEILVPKKEKNSVWKWQPSTMHTNAQQFSLNLQKQQMKKIGMIFDERIQKNNKKHCNSKINSLKQIGNQIDRALKIQTEFQSQKYFSMEKEQ